MSSAQPIQPDQLLEVLANVDTSRRRWQRKVQLLAVIGRWGEPHPLGVRDLAHRCHVSQRLLGELLGELVMARALVVVELGAGSRPTTWLVSAAVDRWEGVPWLRDVDAVVRWSFHVERPPELHEPPIARARRGQERAPASTARGPRPSSARQISGRAVGGSGARAADGPARGIAAAERALAAGDGQEGSPPAFGPDHASPDELVAGAGVDRQTWAGVRGAVLGAAIPGPGGRGPFLNGAPLVELAQLVALAGPDELLQLLADAPGGLGVPMLVDWLVTRWHRPTGPLAAADGPGGPEPTAPALRPFTGHEHADALTADDQRERIAQLRSERDG